MYKVLVVDDERQIRLGLKAKLNWNEHGFELCGEAADGKEALELIAMLRPDVIITDIRMPIMDGISLLQNCSTAHPDIQFIVLSGYEEFSYVKAAMQHGASDYLLKPVVRKELASRLNTIKSVLDARQKERDEEKQLKRQLDINHQRLREQFLLQTARAGAEGEECSKEAARLGLGEIFKSNTFIQFVTLEIKDTRSGASGSTPDSLLLLAVYFMSHELLQLWGEEAHVFRDSATPQLLHLVLKCETFGEEMLERWLKTEFRPQLERMLKVRVQMGIGMVVSGQTDWRKGYLSSRLQWMQQPVTGLHPARSEPENNELKAESFELLPVSEKQLTLAITEGDLQTFRSTLRTLLEPTLTLTLQALSVRVLRLVLFLDGMASKHGLKLEETQHMISGLPESLWQCQTPDKAEALFVHIAQKLIWHMEQGQQSSGHEVVGQVVAYLQEHYAEEDISLSRMASRFHLHVSYLSELFKKITAKNYSEYLTEIRMTKAKELLGDPQLRVSDVSELVGFSNPNYFSQVFKKTTGLSPIDYRQKNDMSKPKIL
ncbi:response regulator [Cohnella sp.]|uniref:response regulator transcription factor n=1 Tax=Cohnella sp. TaxID=1883426 RepID=UPI00356248A8